MVQKPGKVVGKTDDISTFSPKDSGLQNLQLDNPFHHHSAKAVRQVSMAMMKDTKKKATPKASATLLPRVFGRTKIWMLDGSKKTGKKGPQNGWVFLDGKPY